MFRVQHKISDWEVRMYIMTWCVLGGLFLLVELLSPGLFYFFSPALGAFSAAIAAYYQCGEMVQLITCIGVSVITFIFLHCVVKKIQRPSKETMLNVYALIGKRGMVIANSTDVSYAQVKIGGEIWSAIAENGAVLKQGQHVVVKSISGVKLIVEEKVLNTK